VNNEDSENMFNNNNNNNNEDINNNIINDLMNIPELAFMYLIYININFICNLFNK
jgi:hypothetical protein